MEPQFVANDNQPKQDGIELSYVCHILCKKIPKLKSLLDHQYCLVIHKCGYNLGMNSGNHNLWQMITYLQHEDS